jgi:hypothetical protein
MISRGTAAVRRSNKQNWVLFVAVVLALGAFLATVFVRNTALSNTHSLLTCVEDWANKSTVRSERVNAAQDTRTVALATLLAKQHAVFVAANGVPIDQVAFHKALTEDLAAYDDYVMANATLDKTLAANPIPTAPQFVCH